MPELLSLLSTGESQVLEFKASFDKAAIESLVAFANARGGKVLEFPVKPVSTKGRYYKRVASSNHPLRHNIHIGRFKTPSTIIDDRQFTDTLFEAVEQSMKFIISHIAVAFEFDGSVQRKERFAYPLPAIREALINAVVHRSYTDPNDIQIKIFDNKISIFSPGIFYGGLTIAEIQQDSYRSSLRNKLVAEGFYLTNVIEKYGSGFIRIRRAMADYPEVKFSIEEAQGGVWAVFELTTLTVEQIESPQVTPQVQQLLQHLEGEMSRLELMDSLQLSDRKNFSDSYLKPALAQGLIEMTRPETPNSRLQKYRRRALQ
ncbi:MAG: ATP-binding protein [Azonexus sp.]|jgi:ATP-dependent DNA helicase RecG|nr:ATP-binding protein [Azonexus sp.]